MASNLNDTLRTNKGSDFLPVPLVQLERLHEALMFIFSPAFAGLCDCIGFPRLFALGLYNKKTAEKYCGN